MKLWALAVLLLCVPSAVAQGDLLGEATFHQFHDLVFDEADFVSDCDTGGVEISEAGRAFTFVEEQSDDDTTPAPFGGTTTSGCGVMRSQVPVIPTANHVIVRFGASRDVTTFDALNADADIIQDLVLRDEDERELQSRAIFEAAAPSQELQPFAFTFAADLGDSIFVDWVFRDSGLTQTDPFPGTASGQDFSATVRDATVEAHGPVPANLVTAGSEDRRDGTRLTTEHKVAVDVPAFDQAAVAVRVLVAPGLDLLRVEAPDGTDLGAPQSLEEGVLGYDHDFVAIRLEEGGSEAVVPRPLVAEHGPGTYTFVFEESEGLEVSATLLPFAILLLAAPIPFAILAWIESRAFRREAFGGYARSARNLQYGVGLVFLYYVAVVASAAAGGRLDLMALVPMPLEGVLLYVQVVLAVVAFTVLWLVARELYLLVKPRPATHSAPASDDAF